MSQFQFVMRSGPTPGKVFPIDGGEVTIGRDANQTISINDAEISRKHAKMELRGTSYVIQDLGSTNGTFVNGNRVSGIQVLNPNDIVSFGENIVLMFEAVVDPNATMISSKAPRTSAAMPKPAPISAPAPAPVYAPPAPVAAAAPSASAKKGGKKLILIIILVVVVCLILGCVALLLWIDADKTGARWCQILPFLARWLGATCP
jgi:predicted component of type VI protein secretion system